MKQLLFALFLLACFSACDMNDRNKPELWKNYTMDNSALFNNYVQCVAVDSNDHVWTGNFYGDVAEFDGIEWTYHATIDSGVFNNSIYSIAIGRDNTVWAGSDLGLFRFKNGSWTYAIPPAYSWWNISDVEVAGDGSIWLCNPYLWKYGTEDDWTSFNNIVATQMDIAKNGDIWLCSNNGLTRYSDQVFMTYTTSNSGLPQNNIFTLKIDKYNRVCAGTQNSGLFWYNGGQWIVYDTTNSAVPSNRIQAIAFDRNDHLWIGTDQGAAFYDNEQWTVYNTGNSGLGSNNVTGIAVDSKNNVWIATYGGGLAVFNPNGL